MPTTRNAARRPANATQPRTAEALVNDREFASANQQLEEYADTITAAVVAHEPDLSEITQATPRFGAQAPSNRSAKQVAVFRKTKQLAT